MFRIFHLIRRLTSEEREKQRVELIVLEERILAKILKITWTHQKLPYDRLAKGKRLKECCLSAIAYLDLGNDEKLQDFLRELRK
jgi:hypothetical protein